jgi:hypothetical protein
MMLSRNQQPDEDSSDLIILGVVIIIFIAIGGYIYYDYLFPAPTPTPTPSPTPPGPTTPGPTTPSPTPPGPTPPSPTPPGPTSGPTPPGPTPPGPTPPGPTPGPTSGPTPPGPTPGPTSGPTPPGPTQTPGATQAPPSCPGQKKSTKLVDGWRDCLKKTVKECENNFYKWEKSPSPIDSNADDKYYTCMLTPDTNKDSGLKCSGSDGTTTNACKNTENQDDYCCNTPLTTMYKIDECICEQADIPRDLVSTGKTPMNMKRGTCGEKGYKSEKGSGKISGTNIDFIKYENENSPCPTPTPTPGKKEGFTNYQPRCNDLLNDKNNPNDSTRYDNYYDF